MTFQNSLSSFPQQSGAGGLGQASAQNCIGGGFTYYPYYYPTYYQDNQYLLREIVRISEENGRLKAEIERLKK